MRKILFLCSAFLFLCGLSASGQITFNLSAATVTSGQEVVITSSGENDAIAMGSKYISSISNASVESANPSTYFTNQSISTTAITYYRNSNTNPRQPTKVFLTPKNTSSVPVTVNYKIRVDSRDMWENKSLPPFDYTFTITVNPAPVIFYNQVKSQTFYNQNCATGTQAQPYVYTVAAGTYSSTISQTDANNKAQQDVNTNGQSKANQLGGCAIVYSSAAISGSFTKNNCTEPYYAGGTSVPYSIPTGQFTSTISQADADAQAQAYFNTNGQVNANANGSCIYGNMSYIRYTNGAKPGSKITRLKIKNSAGNVIYDFSETQLLAGQSIVPGIYTFEFNTIGPITSGNTGWRQIGINLSQPDIFYFEQYNNGTATTYTFTNVNTTNSHSIQVYMHFQYI